MSHTCGILVVGGGVIGTSIAFHLAQRRAGRIMLVEKAYGASGKSEALIYQAHRHPLIASLARRCLPVFKHFTDLIGGPPVFWRTGMVQLMPRRDEAELEARIAQLGIDLGGHVVPPSGPNGKKREGVGQDVHASVPRNHPSGRLTARPRPAWLDAP
jgi:glycine/D-amino acid oxidase-like deaminating enzyme